jgi:hypothetical protein
LCVIDFRFLFVYNISVSSAKNMQQNNSTAKFTFLYLTHAVFLLFTSFALFVSFIQITNKALNDYIDYFGSYYPDELRGAVAIFLVSAPFYFLSLHIINQKLFKGEMPKDLIVRKWFSWFIIFFFLIAAAFFAVILVYLFLGGDYSFKLFLQLSGSILIALVILSYYFFEIKRKNTQGAKSRLGQIYFYIFLQIIILVCFYSFFIFESPGALKNKIYDSETTRKIYWLEKKIQSYYNMNDDIPETLVFLTNHEFYNTGDDDIRSPDNKIFGYTKITSTTYELCADFKTSNIMKSKKTSSWRYSDYDDVKHKTGEQCFFYKIKEEDEYFDQFE